MNTREKGDMAVAAAIQHYAEEGYEVLTPLSDKQKFDLVVYRDGVFRKIQCKYAGSLSRHKTFEVSLLVCGGNQSRKTKQAYKNGDFDFLFIATAWGEIYEIPWKKIKGYKKSISLGKIWEEYRIKGRLTHQVVVQIDGKLRMAERRVKGKRISWLTADEPEMAVAPDYMEEWFANEKHAVN
ncbi:MAG: group I intron-associated PD-(D/E)XK endonuclease [Promethearchaeota archaeon]|jgi:hypothetical protein